MKNYLEDLNTQQRLAVEHTAGPSMIISGAGSGKTRVLIYRIAHLIKQGVDPFNILALTFTNKAAREMKERIAIIVNENEARNIWMGTFHSVFARILRYEADKIGYPSNFTIYDTENSRSLLKSIIKEMGLDDNIYKPGLVHHRISSAKNSLISSTGYLNDPDLLLADKQSAKPKLGEVYHSYENRCFKAGAMDFDDLLFKTNVLLKNFPEALYKYQEKFRFVLVDEFQDTNYSQYLILKSLSARFENICVVGDDAQSIYGFRGANIQNILNFQKDYSDTKVFLLEQNYRSTQNIVTAANSIIAKNKNQLEKKVWTANDEGEKIPVLRSLTDNEEGLTIANQIFSISHNKQLLNSAFAILYRTNAQSRAFEEALRKLNIPYRIYGGLSFYKRKEVKDLISYFSLVINHHDEESLKRVINYPARGVGKTTIEKIIVKANETGNSLWTIIENQNDFNLNVTESTKNKLSDFVTMIKSFAVMVKTHSAYDTGNNIAVSSGILRELYNDKTPEGVSRYDNIQELLNGLKEFSDKYIAEGKLRTLDEFMQDVALLTDADDNKDDNTDKVSLMTIHAAKGLEFPYVFIAGMEENLFPSHLSLNSRADLEEERRLFYVALTRAKKQAVLSYATSRYKWGKLEYCEPSRFIDEIDSACLDMTNAPTAGKGDERTNGIREFGSSSFSKNYFFKRRFKSNGGASFSETKKPHVASPAQSGGIKKLVKFNTDISSNHDNFAHAGAQSLQVGMEVEHQRFGTGKILNIEGGDASKKATVFFPAVGQKQLLLRFAKLKIVK